MRLGLLTAEPSGDRLATALIAALDAHEVFGSAGPSVPCRALVPRRELGAVGLVEGMKQGPSAWASMRSLVGALVRARPDVVVSIDSPSFHLRLAPQLRRRGIRVVHWVSPQVWAWRPGRVDRIARSVDALACLFPFEPGMYAHTGLRTLFTGHPTMCGPISSRPLALGVAAGSRNAERRRLGRVFAKVAAALALPVVEAVPPGMEPVVAGATQVGDVAALAGRVAGALVCSGTATLELAVAGVPMVAAYRLHPASWWAARHLVRLRSAVLPNLLLGKRVVPELLQEVPAAGLEAHARALFGPLGDRMRQDLLEVRALLDGRSAASRMARLVSEVADRRSTH